MPIQSTSPAMGEVLKVFTELSLVEITNKISLAHSTYIDWKKTSFSERAKLMQKLAEIFTRDEKVLAHLMAIEMGKPISAGIAEIQKCVWGIEYYADNAEKFLSNEIVSTNAKESYVAFESLGIIFAVMPWNFPFWQVIRFAVPAIMAGNVCLLKHASNVPQCALIIEEKFLEAGFPVGVFQTLLVGSEKVINIINDSRVKAATLTGSEYAGSQLSQQAGKIIKKTVLELGGSDPFIILSDANVQSACESGVMARLQNTGQSCIAAKRFIVVEDRYDVFLEKFLAIWKNVRMGDPLDETTQIGPMYSQKALETIEKQVNDSVNCGAKILIGGKRVAGVGYFYEPTILIDVKPGMLAYSDEIFGPVASIIKVRDEAEAVHVANDVEFGLGASLWTESLETAKRLIPQIESGSVFVNSMVKSDPRLPFGGIKKSGYGRELSHYGIKEFVNIKTVYIN